MTLETQDFHCMLLEEQRQESSTLDLQVDHK